MKTKWKSVHCTPHYTTSYWSRQSTKCIETATNQFWKGLRLREHRKHARPKRGTATWLRDEISSRPWSFLGAQQKWIPWMTWEALVDVVQFLKSNWKDQFLKIILKKIKKYWNSGLSEHQKKPVWEADWSAVALAPCEANLFTAASCSAWDSPAALWISVSTARLQAEWDHIKSEVDPVDPPKQVVITLMFLDGTCTYCLLLLFRILFLHWFLMGLPFGLQPFGAMKEVPKKRKASRHQTPQLLPSGTRLQLLPRHPQCCHCSDTSRCTSHLSNLTGCSAWLFGGEGVQCTEWGMFYHIHSYTVFILRCSSSAYFERYSIQVCRKRKL